MAETAEQKKAREEKEAKDAAEKAAASSATSGTTSVDPPRGAGTPATPEGKEGEMSTQEKAAAGTGQRKSDALLMKALADTKPEEPERPTYDQNRWCVGEGHSMFDKYVQGEEVDIEELIQGLGKSDEEKAYHLSRLIKLGALARLPDQAPTGGNPSGPIAPLMTPAQRRMDTSDSVRMMMGKDLREQVSGQPSRYEQEGREAAREREFHLAQARNNREA